MTTDDCSRLLSLLSHELRSPLGVVRGYLRLLEQTGTTLAEPQRQVVAAAIKATDRATELLGQVNAFVQFHRQEVAIDRQPITVNHLVATAIGPIQQPGDRIVHLQQGTLSQERVSVDAALLQPALTTLITAVVAAQPRDATVTVSARAERSEAGHNEVRLDATALPDVDGDAIEGPLNTSRGGLGLELPIAAVLIEAHGGRIRERHRGSRLVGMIVWLPLTS